MHAPRDLAQLHKQLHTLEETRRGLTARLQLTVNALALTLDAETSTQRSIDASSTYGHLDASKRGESAHRLREAERYRVILRLLAADGDAAAGGYSPVLEQGVAFD